MGLCKLLTRENIKVFVESFDTIFTDCDGVLWNGSVPIKGAMEALRKFETLGKKIFYVTNNSRKSRKEYAQKFSDLGINAKEENIVGSAFVAAQYVKNNLKYSGKAFVVGEAGIQKELAEVGIESQGVGPYSIGNMGTQELASLELDPEIKCVVVGLDTEFSYYKMALATRYLLQPDCHFVATNDDSGLPMGGGVILPGAGACLSALQTASGRQPDAVCGKPHPPTFTTLSQLHSIDSGRTLMIGDRLNTDILFAGNCDLRSLLVLSGVSSLDDVAAKTRVQADDPVARKQIPDFYAPSLDDVQRLLDDVVAGK